MRKTHLIAALAMLATTSASAGQWEHSATYINAQPKDADFHGSALLIGVGYNIPVGPHTSLTPELAFGKGVGSSTYKIDGTEFSATLGDVFAANVRVRIDMTEMFNLQFTPGLTYSELEADTGMGGVKLVSDGEWDPSLGAGFGVKVNKNTELSVSYSRIFGSDDAGDTDIFGATVHYRF